MKHCVFSLVIFMTIILSSQNALTQIIDDPCPVPEAALGQTPTDLATVQADIDRYTLCLERAQLIKRLNDLATENDATLSGFGNRNPGLSLDERLLSESQEEENESETEAGTTWKILEIFGSAKKLEARLIKDASVIQVRAGELLPDGTRVEKVTPTEVIISDREEKSVLAWSN